MDTKVNNILTLIFSDDIVNVQLGLTLAASQRGHVKDKILSDFIDRLLWSCCTDDSISIIKDKTCWYGSRKGSVTINGRVGTWCITIKLDTSIVDNVHGVQLLDGDRCKINWNYAYQKFDIIYRCMYSSIQMRNPAGKKSSLSIHHTASGFYGYQRDERTTGSFCTLTDKSDIHKYVSYMGLRNSRKIYKRLLKLIQPHGS